MIESSDSICIFLINENADVFETVSHMAHGKWRKRLKMQAMPPFAKIHKVRVETCITFLLKKTMFKKNLFKLINKPNKEAFR